MRKIDLDGLCDANKFRITDQRRLIVKVLAESDDHPDVDTLHARATAEDPGISIATVYRTLRFLEDAGVIEKHDFGDGRGRYEIETDYHHDHLIDLTNGIVLEFSEEDMESLSRQIAQKLGYKLISQRIELYAVPLDEDR